MNRRHLLAAFAAPLLALGLASTGASAADGYPARPIKLIVPFPAGGSTDILARVMSAQMTNGLGQSMVVDNRPGASTIIGVEAAKNAPPDGYTLLLAVATSLSTNPHFMKQANYKPSDFEPIGFISKTPVIMLINPSVPAKSVAELVTYMKANPGKLQLGTTGTGAFSHLCALMFAAAAGVQLDDVPYRGESPAITALLSNEVQIYFASLPAALPNMQAEKVRALAVTSEQRSPAAPDVPSFVESGLPDVVANAWFGIVAPKGTPQPVIQKLHTEMVKASSSNETKDRLRSDGAVPDTMTVDQFRTYMDGEYKRWARIIEPMRGKLEKAQQ
jgi:tripartite-type tricarboxylate transporter receptor subunit TctC